jgi:putative transposase
VRGEVGYGIVEVVWGANMAGPQPVAVQVSAEERRELERLERGHTTGQQVAVRARLVLMMAEGQNNTQAAVLLGVATKMARHWRRRWLQEAGVPLEERSVAERLADGPRSGAPARISAEQICQIVALACEPPSASGRPISHWTPRELAEEAVRRGVVERVSPRSVGRFLGRGGSQTASGAVLAHARTR